MRRVVLPGIDLETSCLGLGCASLGSRVAPEAGRAALEAAYARGVTWFDVAPAYGGGRAEALLGAFLKGRRERVQVCTKAGLAPPSQGPLRRALTPLVRRAAAAAGPLRAAIRRSGATRNRALPLDPALISGSLEASLRRLGTDRVELYALHRVDPADLERDEILRALEDVLAAGKARMVGVAGGLAAAEAALARAGAPFGAVQLSAAEARAGGVPARAAGGGMACATHSVLGVAGAFDAARRRLARDAPGRAALAAAGYGGGEDGWTAGLARLLLDRALEENPGGVTLVSMFSTRSLSANVAAAEGAPPQGAAALCARLGLDRAAERGA